MHSGQLFAMLSEYRLMLAALICLHAAFLVSTRRARYDQQAKNSWLMATPFADSSLQTWLLVRIGADAEARPDAGGV